MWVRRLLWRYSMNRPLNTYKRIDRWYEDTIYTSSPLCPGTHLSYTLVIYFSCSHSMGRRRAAESVPAVEDGIEEVIIKHRKTKRGIRTTEKVVPVLIQSKEKSGQSSRSKKGMQHQLDLEPEKAEGSRMQLPLMDDSQTHQYIDEQVDDIPDIAPEQGHPHANVCNTLHLHWIETLILFRQ
jgi:hypothetical protein